MKTTITLLRTGSGLAAAGLLVGMLSACTPESKPAPKETRSAAFATDEEAFAAAEATYRAYTEAVNASDLEDSGSFEPVYDLLTGSALEVERESISKYQAADIVRTGDSTFDTFTPMSVSGDIVIANLCIDVSAVQLTYADGSSALPADRLTRAGREVTFVSRDTSTDLIIAAYGEPQGDFKC